MFIFPNKQFNKQSSNKRLWLTKGPGLNDKPSLLQLPAARQAAHNTSVAAAKQAQITA